MQNRLTTLQLLIPGLLWCAGQPVEQSAARQAQQPNAAQPHSRATLQQDQQSVAALLNTGRAGGAASGYVLRDDTQAFITGLGHMAGNPDEKKRVMTHTCWFASWNLCMWDVPRHPSARGQVYPATLLHVLSQELHRSHVCPGSAAAERQCVSLCSTWR